MRKKLKLRGYSAKDILDFASKPANREKVILNTKIPRTPVIYKTNIKAQERHPVKQTFIVESIKEEIKDIKTFRLKRKDKKDPAFFRAGQYIVIRQMIDGKLIARPISLSSSPAQTLNGGFYDITVKKDPNGFMSKYLIDNLKPGDTIESSDPQGNFYYEELRDEKTVIACAGGSGITPFLSMAKAVKDGDEDFDLTILYGVRRESDLIFSDWFSEITASTDKVRLIPVLSDEKKEGFEYGLITADIIKKYTENIPFSLFACGPQSMYRFLDKEADILNLDIKHYRKEIFGFIRDPYNEKNYPEKSKGKIFNVTVNMCSRTYTLPAKSGETLLTSFERAGIAGPSRCRGGVCGYCRSKLIKGDVFIPDSCDTRRKADREFGYIHPCVCFPLSDIILDVPNNR